MLSKNRSTVIVAFDSDAELKAHKACRLLLQAGCDVYKSTVLNGDLGSKSKKDARKTLQNTQRWTDDSMLSHKIMSIKSGSIL